MNKTTPYLNDIVSLFVMLLLAIALIAGEVTNTTTGDNAQAIVPDVVQVVETNPFRIADKVQ
jgi:hypothetical protein